MKLEQVTIINDGQLIEKYENYNFIVRKYRYNGNVYEYVMNKEDSVSTLIRIFKKTINLKGYTQDVIEKIECYQ